MDILYRLAQKRLSAFWWIVLSVWMVNPYSISLQFASVAALWSVYSVFKTIKMAYAGQTFYLWLLSCSAGLGLTAYFNIWLAVWLSLGLLLFSWLHCLLHEREESGIAYQDIGYARVLRRWFPIWGLFYFLPVIMMLVLVPQWPEALQALNGMTWERVGYFNTFHQEFSQVFSDTDKNSPIIFYILKSSVLAIPLVLIGILPVIGILGVGYLLPGRFVYRLLQREDEEMLLLWLAGTAMILSTMGHSSSLTILNDGALAFSLGLQVIHRWLLRRPALERVAQASIVLYLLFPLVLIVLYFLF